ncbi:putative short-chain dehydrogenase [Dinoroseobacter shibae DFL 12 = DSM 16493]|jgi:NAD(P)-dependent dehydrogenase (short-subunit alcohol dehydrogenase family)/putative NADH-flavin reductase|uniref:Putative short-chain dehydrogenase n=1 Tax=Dinoroseobacter shibae (strain DSM 16493 / NCIMB 14021 / DFL 12) TaxID=398580 RepID=A8LP14_DINSH|nr:NAD-dependent epimerase/dehydratase family protein [Dinoroseobacter shibae]ABV93696.1 putative short-chain dehydrogenase [Dinoroseobacter shibae DFL 12 = DSM 16493]URF45149.1 NAD-dependent epimerase/dehydratase family protein [Dinoroseobacter shibae]URF49454.1 NAD-dependent epimerase/dehydratase family protein [Dinoroseobacter shibae]
MKYLVTDAAGAVGHRLAATLVAAGHEVLAFSDSPVNGVASRAWPTRADVLARALAGVDVICAVDLATVAPDAAPALLKRLDKLRVAAGKAGCGRFVLLGRADIYDPALLADKTLLERSATAAPADLAPPAAAALALEESLRAGAGLDWTILRAPMILAPDSAEAKALFRRILIDDAPSPARFHPVDARDVATALATLGTHDRAGGQVFNIAAPAALAARTLDQELGRLARLLNDEATPQDKLRPPHQVADPVLATDKLARLTGVTPTRPIWVSLAETMQQVMKDLRADGTLPPLPEKINPVVKAVELGQKLLAGKTAVITGVTSGIGRATSLLLSRLGATVVGIARNAEAGEAWEAALAEGRHTVPGHFIQADLMSFARIRTLAADLATRFPRIDILINNAGANFPTRRLTEDGVEATLAINHFAPFLLTNLLAGPLKAAPAARIIMVNSDWHRRSLPDMHDLQMESGYRTGEAYCRAKFMNLQITYAMAALLDGTNVTVNAIHPGVVRTGISTRNTDGAPQVPAQARERAQQRMISPEFSAVYLASLATAPDYEGQSGLYLDTDEIKQSHEATYDEDWAWQIWEWSAQITGLTPASA